ncbi:RidA family protein [Niameybacter massiliensis]|uniref:RidA family protein n=1 Tax=Holtiella tumoricola TaxID=3018743 RepID=A0AA42DLN3_9FIRM|nr:RidA family protein [Holtiella tumoricola]MDA3730948.1 RidA family protein [Holtiella tumoricola]
MTKRIVSTDKAPKAIGPYSQAVVVGEMVYTSGQLGLDPETMELKETVQDQAHQACKNLIAVLEEAGSSINNVIKTTVFLADINDFVAVNEVYAQYFTEPFPARSAVQVGNLPKLAKVEIEVIAHTNN